MRLCSINLRTFAQEIFKTHKLDINLEIINNRLQSNVPIVDELTGDSVD